MDEGCSEKLPVSDKFCLVSFSSVASSGDQGNHGVA